jgi:Cyclin, N-terminal domain
MKFSTIEKAFIYTDVFLSHQKIQYQILYLVGIAALILAAKVYTSVDLKISVAR